MLRILVASVGALGLAASGWIQAAGPAATAQQPGKPVGDVKSRFAGTWRLVGTDRLGPKNEVLPPQTPAGAGQIGFIIYDPAGFMGVTLMQSGRQKYADPEQPTAEEARAALSSYTSYFGTFTVNEAEGVVTHRLQGSISPTMAPDQRRQFEFSGNRLMLRPPR